jgi:hypothetical protein
VGAGEEGDKIGEMKKVTLEAQEEVVLGNLKTLEDPQDSSVETGS